MRLLLLGGACLVGFALVPLIAMAQPAPAGRGATPAGRGGACTARCNFDKRMVEGQPIDTRPTQL